jgi:hypothetical protein
MLNQAEPGQILVSRGRRRPGLAALLAVLVAACQDRDRITFSEPSDGVGPVTTIDRPNGPDTTVDEGPQFIVQGKTIDLDGVDTVYFLVIGGNQGFQPFQPRPPTDTVNFGVPISTSGLAGKTMIIQIHGVDSQGNQGAPSTRSIIVR